MVEKNVLIKDKEGNTLYPRTQASLVVTADGTDVETALLGVGGGLSYEDLNEEIEANPTSLIEDWLAYKQEVAALMEAQKQIYEQKINALQTELNELKSVRYVVETWHDGANWYTLYSDNWCEMGGHLGNASANAYTVDFHKEFRDTNISVLVTDGIGVTTSTDTAGIDMAVYVSDVTTKSFRVSIGTSRQNSSWEAKGYIL